MVQPNAPVGIYQLHILVLQINPPIWRRLHVRSERSIATLHDSLQIAFDWSDFHLHRFVIRGKSDPGTDQDRRGRNEQREKKNMKNTVSLTDETAAEVAKLAHLFGVTNDQCVERLLTRFVFESVGNELIVEEVEQIVCQTRPQAAALAKRLEQFHAEIRKNDPTERAVRASAVQDRYGWGVKAVLRREEVAA
jgi:hypothetical protein